MFAGLLDVHEARRIDLARHALQSVEYVGTALELDEHDVGTGGTISLAALDCFVEPCPAAASVRAMMMKSESRRAAIAASILPTCSAISTTGRDPAGGRSAWAGPGLRGGSRQHRLPRTRAPLLNVDRVSVTRIGIADERNVHAGSSAVRMRRKERQIDESHVGTSEELAETPLPVM